MAPPDAERLAQRFRQPVPFSDGARRSNLAYVALSLALLVRGRGGGAGMAAGARRRAARWRSFRPRSSPPSRRARCGSRARVTVASAARQRPVAERPQHAPCRAAPRQRDEPAATAGAASRCSSSGESWVEIRSGNGKLLVSQLNPARHRARRSSGVPPFAVVIGNAQHVRLSYNDKPVDLMPHVKVEVARFTLE